MQSAVIPRRDSVPDGAWDVSTISTLLSDELHKFGWMLDLLHCDDRLFVSRGFWITGNLFWNRSVSGYWTQYDQIIHVKWSFRFVFDGSKFVDLFLQPVSPRIFARWHMQIIRQYTDTTRWARSNTIQYQSKAALAFCSVHPWRQLRSPLKVAGSCR